MKQLKGFTLIEIIIASSITSVILAIVVLGVIRGQDIFDTTNFGLGKTSDTRRALNPMYQYVRIAIHFPDEAFDGNNKKYTAGPTTLIMEIPAAASGDGTTFCNDAYGDYTDTVIYDLDPQTKNLNEIFITSSNSWRTPHNVVVFPNLSYLQFVQDTSAGNRVVHVTLRKDRPNLDTNVTQTYQYDQKMVARNERPV